MAVRAKVAVHLAEVGVHDLHEVCELAVWKARAVYTGTGIVARDAVWSALSDGHRVLPCLCRWQDDVVGRHLAEMRHFCPTVRSLFDEHVYVVFRVVGRDG